jgi:hypothetical protein
MDSSALAGPDWHEAAVPLLKERTAIETKGYCSIINALVGVADAL